MSDDRVDKWTRWIDGTIKNNVLTMHLQRKVWREAGDVLAANPELPDSYWWEFMRDTYATTQAIAVRRQADLSDGVASLAKLVQQISEDSWRFTQGNWMALHGDAACDDRYLSLVLDHGWAQSFGGATGSHLDPAVPAADLARLTSAGRKVRHYVDKHVAHAQASAPAVTLTLDEVHESIDLIGEVFTKYSALLTNRSWATLEPVIDHNWLAAFTVPWAQPEGVRADCTRPESPAVDPPSVPARSTGGPGSIP